MFKLKLWGNCFLLQVFFLECFADFSYFLLMDAFKITDKMIGNMLKLKMDPNLVGPDFCYKSLSWMLEPQ